MMMELLQWCAWCAVHLLDYSMEGEILYWLNSSLALPCTISPAHEYFSGTSLCQNISACVRRWNPFWRLWSACSLIFIKRGTCTSIFSLSTFKCFWILHILRYSVMSISRARITQQSKSQCAVMELHILYIFPTQIKSLKNYAFIIRICSWQHQNSKQKHHSSQCLLPFVHMQKPLPSFYCL